MQLDELTVAVQTVSHWLLQPLDGKSDVEAQEIGEPIANMAVVRSFRYPGGREWTASVTLHPTKRGSRALRFSAGARSIDVGQWPADWADLPDEQLIAILRRAAPRGALAASPKDQRRWDDRRA